MKLTKFLITAALLGCLSPLLMAEETDISEYTNSGLPYLYLDADLSGDQKRVYRVTNERFIPEEAEGAKWVVDSRNEKEKYYSEIPVDFEIPTFGKASVSGVKESLNERWTESHIDKAEIDRENDSILVYFESCRGFEEGLMKENDGVMNGFSRNEVQMLSTEHRLEMREIIDDVDNSDAQRRLEDGVELAEVRDAAKTYYTENLTLNLNGDKEEIPFMRAQHFRDTEFCDR